MSFSLEQALIELTKLTENGRIATQEELRNLADRVSSFSEGNETVLFSGKLADGSSTSNLVSKMVDNGEDIRAIGRTAAADFLKHPLFVEAIANTFGTDIRTVLENRAHAANFFLEGVDGLWGDLSQRFASETTGKVRIVLGDFDPDRIFGVREMPEIQANIMSGKISETAGYTRAELLQFEAKGVGLRNVIITRAFQETVLSGATANHYQAFLNMVPDDLKALIDQADASQVEQMRVLTKNYPLSTSALKILSRLGGAAGALGFLIVSYQAADAYQNGRPDEALHLIEDFAAEAAASGAAGWAAGSMASLGLSLLAGAGVAVSAPVSIAVVLGAGLLGGYFGGEGIKEATYLFQDHTEERRRDIAKRMLKLMFGENLSLGMPIASEMLAQKSISLDATFSREQIVEYAKNNIAWRYALQELNPFVLEGPALYEKHNTNGELDIYDPETDTGIMTEIYLKDRAAMLTWRLRYDKENKSYSSEYNTPEVKGNWDFVDIKSGVAFQIDGLTVGADHQIVFGSKESDLINGSSTSDHLFGGNGDDSIDGGAGDDYLEGNAGKDTLIGGAGFNTLIGGAGEDTYQITNDG